MFWPFLIGFGVLYAVNTVLALRQSRHFSATFIALRRRGRVAIGKYKGLVVAGAIVLFLLDEDGRIVEGTRLSGVTALARFGDLPQFNGLLITEVSAAEDRRLAPSLRKAVTNATENYRVITGGGTASEPPGPFTRLGAKARALLGRRAVA